MAFPRVRVAVLDVSGQRRWGSTFGDVTWIENFAGAFFPPKGPGYKSHQGAKDRAIATARGDVLPA